MFSIYEVNGRSFRDTLENLRKIKRKSSPRSVQFHEHLEDTTKPSGEAHSPFTQACQKYRQAFPVSEREKVVHAHQIMSTPVRTIQSTTTMASAWKLYSSLGYHQIPVLNDKSQIVGLLTEGNLLQHIIIENDQVISRRTKIVSEIMTKEVIAADPVTDVRRIAAVMLEYRQPAVPITTEDDQLLGIISRSDILRITSTDPPLSLWT